MDHGAALAVSFDLQGGIWLVLARGMAVGGLLGLFGALLFNIAIAPEALNHVPPEQIHRLRERLRAAVRTAAAIGVLALPVWLAVQSATMADAASIGETCAAIPDVALHTLFGHLVCAQFALLLATALLAWPGAPLRTRTATVLAGAGAALQAGHSHAFAMHGGPSVLLLADAVHLLAAGAWLGGLVPLLILVRHAPPRAGAMAARRFSPLGKWCVAAMAITAAYQGWVLVASLPGLVGTAYGWLALVKSALFAVLVGFACANRYRFAPALLRDAPDAARATLVRSITVQSAFALAVIAAAATLSQLPPSMHTQPWWPFAWQFSLAAVREDADIEREVLGAACVFGAGAALLVSAILVRRIRWFAAAGAVAAVWWSTSHFGPLLVDASPTEFYRSPTGFAAATIAEGRAIFAANCVTCHGATGRGDGPLAKSLPVPPADLTAGHLWAHRDGELFWWLTHGIDGPEGGALAMPGFAATLDADQRWAVIDYIRAHNAGTAAHGTGTWPRLVAAPAFTAICDGQQTTLASLHGRFVRLIIGPAPPGAPTTADAATCVSADPTVAQAYAIVAGLNDASMPGREFLVDDQGLLRAMHPPDAWDDATTLAATIARLRTAPAPPAAAGAPMDMSMPGMKM